MKDFLSKYAWLFKLAGLAGLAAAAFFAKAGWRADIIASGFAVYLGSKFAAK